MELRADVLVDAVFVGGNEACDGMIAKPPNGWIFDEVFGLVILESLNGEAMGGIECGFRSLSIGRSGGCGATVGVALSAFCVCILASASRVIVSRDFRHAQMSFQLYIESSSESSLSNASDSDQSDSAFRADSIRN